MFEPLFPNMAVAVESGGGVFLLLGSVGFTISCDLTLIYVDESCHECRGPSQRLLDATGRQIYLFTQHVARNVKSF